MTDEIVGWFTGRLPDGWFTGPPEIAVDREEIVVLGEIDVPDDPHAVAGRVTRFREETRDARMRIADEAQAAF